MNPPRYLRNAWYVASWARDVAHRPVGLTLLEEPVLLWRDTAGRAHAIGGRCPHRFAPLALGRQVDDTIECPYHGLRFDATGHCVHNPHLDGALPPKAAVPNYPLVERHGLLWIWMGDAARADAATIPNFEWLANPQIEHVGGVKAAPGHYQLYVDNILDLGHANFVHPQLRSNAWTIGERAFSQQGDTVSARYTRLDDLLAPGIDAVFGTAGRSMDMIVTVDWQPPSVLFLDYRAGPPGTPQAQMESLPSLHAFTPQDAKTTHYFWAVGRGFRLGDTAFTEAMRQSFVAAFEDEDMPIIRAQHQMMGERDFWSLDPISLPGDNGGLRARRTLDKLIAAEASGTPPR